MQSCALVVGACSGLPRFAPTKDESNIIRCMVCVCVEFRWGNTIFAACVVSLHTCNLFFLFVLCIMQLKAYARFQGKPTTWDKKDMVFVSLGYAYDEDITEHVVLARSQTGERLMLAAFVCLTVLIGLILMWITTAYYETFWAKLGGRDATV